MVVEADPRTPARTWRGRTAALTPTTLGEGKVSARAAYHSPMGAGTRASLMVGMLLIGCARLSDDSNGDAGRPSPASCATVSTVKSVLAPPRPVPEGTPICQNQHARPCKPILLHALRIHLVDRAGKRVRGAEVIARDGKFRERLRGDDGIYVGAGCRAGNYSVTASVGQRVVAESTVSVDAFHDCRAPEPTTLRIR